MKIKISLDPQQEKQLREITAAMWDEAASLTLFDRDVTAYAIFCRGLAICHKDWCPEKRAK